MTYRRTEQHPVAVFFGVLFAVAFVITYWPFFVAAGAGVAAWFAGRGLYRDALRRRAEREAIIARADFEHAALMAGDTWRGTFGQYEPAPWWRL